MLFRSPQKLGKYKIVEEIGRGGFGTVYKALDTSLGDRVVALKVLAPYALQDPEFVARFYQEAHVTAKLKHRNIVVVYEVGEAEGAHYLAMEFLEGVDLHKYCRKGALLPLRNVLFVISETALALDYAHKHGVIHRDIKPANIMLLKDGKVRVTDFGIAKAMSSSQTKSGIVLGTPNYMSPEQINGAEIDGRSDIFSLGVVFFELLTGQLPFQGKNLTNLFYQITQAKHPSARSINPKVPRPCDQIIDKALGKDPNQRFATVADFAKYTRAMMLKIDQVRAQVKT